MSDYTEKSAFKLLTNPIYLDSPEYQEVETYLQKTHSTEIKLFIDTVYNKLYSFQTKKELGAAFECFKLTGNMALNLSERIMMTVTTPLDSPEHTLNDVKASLSLNSTFIQELKKELDNNFAARMYFETPARQYKKKSPGFFSCFGCCSRRASAAENLNRKTPHVAWAKYT